MNIDFRNLLSKYVKPQLIEIGMQSINSFNNSLLSLLSNPELPFNGLNKLEIQSLLFSLAIMDSNNYKYKVSAGEREGRIYSDIVYDRVFGLAHGMGRSGNIGESQPKAVGSSLLVKLCEFLVKSALRECGCGKIENLILLPLATGMSISLTFMSLKKQNPKAKYIISSRIDQKTCIKAITAVDMIPIILENKTDGDSIYNEYTNFQQKISEIQKEEILCFFSITSGFAPRIPDQIFQISQLAKKSNIPFVINNAYGLQCSLISKEIKKIIENSEVDYVIQSTDKNFMVPVGGSIVFSSKKKRIEELSKIYPGRASSQPIIDLFITLLQLGKKNWSHLLQYRIECMEYLKEQLQQMQKLIPLQLINSPKNTISIALTLQKECKNYEQLAENFNNFGGMLYKSGVMGARIVNTGIQEIEGIKFQNFGSHINEYKNLPYITIAAAIGGSKQEIDQLISLLVKNFKKFEKKTVQMSSIIT